MFEVAIANVLILCTNHTDLGIKDSKKFRVMLAKSLIGDYCSHKRSSRPIIQPTSKRFCPDHFPVRGSDKNHRCHYTVRCIRRRDTKRSVIVGIAATTSATMGQKRTASTCITPNMYQALVRLILIISLYFVLT